MALLYDRKEDQNEIVITYKYQAAFYIILPAFVLIPVLLHLNPQIQYILMPFMVIFAVVWLAGKWSPNQEIGRAMKNGKVDVSGSKFSFSNPLVFKIKK